jgi:adenylate cyclase
MRVGAKSVAIWVLPLAVLAAALALVASDFGHFASRVRGLEFDTYQHVQPRPYEYTADKSGFAVRVLDVDDASIARFGRWPWPHSVLAKLVAQLKTAGAAIVVLAFPLDEEDAAAPERVARLLPQSVEGNAARAALSHLPSLDDALAASLSLTKVVTGVTLGEAGPAPPVFRSEISVAGGSSALQDVRQFQGASAPLAKIEAASAGEGSLNVFPDADGTLRSVPMISRLGDRVVPSLEAEVMRLASGESGIVIRTEESGLPGIGSGSVVAGASAGSLDVPLGANGALQIYFSGSHAERNVSAAALDEGQIAPAELKNAIVFVAPPGARVETPNGRRTLAEVSAEATENILLDDALKPVSSPAAALVFLLVAGLGIVVLFARANTIWAGAFSLLAIGAAQGLSWLLFSRSHVLLDAATPNVSLVLMFLSGLSARMFDVARTRAELKGSFSDLLPVKSIEEIAHAPGLLKLGGERRVVTSLSCGVRGYAALATSFAEDPAGFTRVINMTMAPLIEDAVSHGAMIGPFDGEYFTAYWNAPLDDSEHAMHACEAASRMTMSLAEVNDQLSRERRLDGTTFDPVEVGIGIATGSAITGGLSSRGRTSYSVTGECTVLAARIRALSGQYGPAVVVGEATREAASRGHAFLEVDFLALGPKEQPVKLYAMLGNPLVRASPKFRALATFHEHIFQSLRTQQWEKTRDLIEQCRKLSGASQKMYDLHLARIAYFEANPPGDNWDGAFRQVVT